MPLKNPSLAALQQSRSRFCEGSMNDRASAAPPVHFLGPDALAALEQPASNPRPSHETSNSSGSDDDDEQHDAGTGGGYFCRDDDDGRDGDECAAASAAASAAAHIHLHRPGGARQP
ncbi:hypothetical protein BBAD15_g6113 [Beauveria bassiana D1-5]|uniref:Uncharacterized protein n=1 Tax=Beauveria bassiana D1-5 TaxID=1245745 RepID=A0A0A2VLW9_BEABA|nr:hypothetical protein BBAD15_g6113 [Beauveria bassiana D1-5]